MIERTDKLTASKNTNKVMYILYSKHTYID